MSVQKKRTENNLTEGNVWTTMVRFTAPFLLANLIQALYGAVDLAVIGRFCSPESVAAVSTGTQVTQIITSLITGLTMGATVLTGKYTGMKEEKAVKETIGTTFAVFTVVAGILTVLMLSFVEPVLKTLQTPEEAFVYAKTYVVICSLGILFICGYNAISAVLRGCGDSVSPMIFMAVSCVLNIIGDMILTGCLGLGVAGVAIATIGAQAVSMICAIVYLNRKNCIFTFRLKNFKIKGERVKELAKVGIPVSLQECMVRISFLYLLGVTNRLGVFAAAAVGIAGKYDVFAMLPATSVAGSMAAITAQNYGAGKPKRAFQSLMAGIGFAFSISFLFWMWAQLSPQTMIGIFSRDARTVQEGIPFFRTCSYDYLAVSFVFCLNGYLNGRSQTLFTMISVCFGALALRMPLIWLVNTYLPGNLGAIGMIAPIVSGIMAVYTLVYVLGDRRKCRTLSSDG